MTFLQVGKKVDRFFRELSAKPILPVGLGDENVAESLKGGKQENVYNYVIYCF